MRAIMLTALSLLVGCVSIVLVGCNSGKPDGFPAVHPTTVTVRDGTKPLPNVKLMFYAPAGSTETVPCAVSGKTDANGVAQIYSMQAAYVAKGAPAGKYTVTAADIIEVEHHLPIEERARLSPPAAMAYETERNKRLAAVPRVVPAALCADVSDPKNRGKELSPLVLEVKSGKNSLEVDVATYK